MDFSDYLSEELGWRKLEISSLYTTKPEELDESPRSMIWYKSMILLLYSHWEGYIKCCYDHYFESIHNLNIKLDDLTSNFYAIYCKTRHSELKKCIKSNEDDLDLFHRGIEDLNELLKDSGICFEYNSSNTCFNFEASNIRIGRYKILLQYFNFKNIDEYNLIADFFNNTFIESRNQISHGAKQDIVDSLGALELDKIDRIKHYIITLLDILCEQLSTYYESEYYLKLNMHEKEEYDESQRSIIQTRLRMYSDTARL